MLEADTLVGRSAELAVLDGAVAALQDGPARPLVVQGEAGIGKTRLLAELAGRANARRFTVLSGSASELEQDLPFWLFVDALDDYVAGLDPRVLAGLGDEVRAEVAHVLPSLAEHATDGRLMVQDERYRTHRAIRELLGRLAAREPIVLVLDDVHWADPSSVELLAGLLRVAPDARVLLALGLRPHQAPRPLAAALERAARQGGLERVALTGLALEEAAALLGDRPDAAGLAGLHAQTGGNPFYLEQLRRAPGAGAGGSSPVVDGGLLELGVPRAVVVALDEELALLDDGPRRLLRGAAVAGDPFDADLAAAAAGIGTAPAMDALDDLLVADLVRVTDVPRRFRFRHPLVRHAVYQGTPAGWRLGAHERCAAALAEVGAPVVVRAHHVEHAARPGDAAALAVLLEAGRAAAMRAPGSAVRWLSAGLRLLGDAAPLEQRLELLLARARALAATGRLQAAHDDLAESLTLVPEQAGALRVRLIGACSEVEHLLGRHEQAHARLLGAVRSLRDPQGPDAAALEIQLAADAMYASAWEEMQSHAGQGVAIARQAGDRALLAAALATLALAHGARGATADAEAACDEAAALVDALPDPELAAQVAAIAHLAAAEMFVGRHRAAHAHAQRGFALGRAAGSIHPTLAPTLAMTSVMLGRLDEAAAVMDAWVEAARVMDVDQALAWALVNGAGTARYAGETASALSMADEAVERSAGLDPNHFSGWADVAHAFVRLDAGDAQEAMRALGRSGAEDGFPAVPAPWRVAALDALVQALVDTGRAAEAAPVADRARAVADALSLPLADVWADRAGARAALAAGEPARAAALAAASAATAERAGTVIEAAISRVLAGRALAAAGDPGAAAAFEQAARQFQAVGARRRRDAAERELRRLGHQVYRRSRAGTAGHAAGGIASLTGRELEIARLVVDRRTNPEIAGELFLSLKTVESHLRNIFRKLDVPTRVELARKMERAEAQRSAPSPTSERTKSSW